LIPKGKVDANHPKARPICLFDDIGKFFERILNGRLNTLSQLRTRPSRLLVSDM